VTARRAELAIARPDPRRPSVVTAARPAGPLRLLAPRGRGDAAWVYQASLGGGFVGGDDLALTLDVGAGAALFLGSQASSKVYRGARGRFALDATVGEGATLVAWPEPVTCFAGAALDQRQRFALAETARLVVVDGWTAGRIARGERWAFARMELALSVTIAGATIIHDGVLLDPAHGPLAPRLAGLAACATVIVVGLPVAALLTAAAAFAMPPRGGAPLVAASAWPWGAVIRIGAPTTECLSRTLRLLIGPLVARAVGAEVLVQSSCS
jgi:urease accessory protein